MALALAVFPLRLWAAFPQVASEATSEEATNVTSHDVSYPASIASGDLLIAAFSCDGTATASFPNEGTDWTVLVDIATSAPRVKLAYRIASGAESGTFTVTTSATEMSSHHVWRITGHDSGTAPQVASANSSSDSANADPPNLTPTGGAKDYLWLALAAHDMGNSATMAFSAFPSSYTNTGQEDNDSTQGALAGWGRRELNAASENPGTFTVDVAETWNAVTVAVHPVAAALPTFTAAPAVGTRTTSSIPITFTSDTTGTVHGVAVADGSGASTCDAIEAETATGEYLYFHEAVTATVADSGTFSSYTDGTVRDGYFCIEDGSGNDSSVASIADMYKLPAFTTPLTIASQTDTTYTTNSKVLDGPGLVDLVACVKDASAPSVAQVEAGTGGCILSGSEDDATGTMTLNPSGGDFPVYDLYYVGSYGGQHEATVHTLADEFLDAPSGKQFETLASISATSFCDLIDSPDVAAGDIITIDLATDPAAFDIDIANDCDVSYEGDESRQSITYTVYDTSAGDFMAGGPGTLWFNNQPPEGPDFSPTFRLRLNEAINPVDLTTYCTDPELDTLSVISLDALPAGLSIAASVLSGTPTAAGVTDNVTFRCTDITGASTDWD